MAQRVLVPDDFTGKVLGACCSRRGFLRSSVAAGLAAAAAASKLPRAFADDRPIPPGARLAGHGKAKRAVFLYLAGGPSHIDTFDPKPGRETGGPFKTVNTPLPGVHFSEHLPQLAATMPHLSVIRGMTSKEGNHSRARTLVHTAYPPEATVKHPTFGSAVSERKGSADFDLPSFVAVGPSQDGPAFLGVHHAPFVIGNATRPIQNLAYHRDVGKKRTERRLGLLDSMQEDFAASHGDSVTAGQDSMFSKAKRLVDSPLTQAFDVSKEKPAVREAYGRNAFGQGCLMARRLLEAGVSCVEVVLGGWDTHDDNFEKVPELCAQLDPAAATLVADLASRGLLEDTLVILLGEFGRTPRINPRGGRDHWARAWSAVVAGGGVLGGQVIGETDADGMAPKERPVGVADLHASFWHAFGVDPWTEYHANDRPITLVPKEGRVVPELFA